jgi:hypothetical protein
MFCKAVVSIYTLVAQYFVSLEHRLTTDVTGYPLAFNHKDNGLTLDEGPVLMNII